MNLLNVDTVGAAIEKLERYITCVYPGTETVDLLRAAGRIRNCRRKKTELDLTKDLRSGGGRFQLLPRSSPDFF